MLRDDQPYALGDSAVLSRRRRALTNSHVAPLKRFAARVRRCHPGAVPDFDPLDGGIFARVLFVAERPGPKALKTGFISRENPDQTARNLGALLNAARIPRSDTVLWNILPWFDSRRAKITASDLSAGADHLSELIVLLPHLHVIVFVGRRAQRAVRMVGIPDGVKVLNCPHPSSLNLNADPRQRPAILKVLKAVAAIMRQ
jgi:uracil-DNA glycosylase